MLPGRKLSPDYLLRALQRRWWMVALPTFLCAFGALLVSRFLPNQYQSETLIQIVPQRVPDSYVRTTVTTDLEERLKSISQQIKSRARIEELITTLDLYPEQRKAMPMEDVVGIMRQAVVVEVGPRGRGPRGFTDPDSFRLKFTYHDAQTAQKVTEELASWFIGENSRIRAGQATSTSEFLEQQLAEARSRLVAHEKKMEAFRQRHAGSLPSQLQGNMQAIQSWQMELQAVVSSIETDRARKAMTERLYNDAVAEQNLASTTAPVTPSTGDPLAATNLTARQQLEAARQQLARLEQRLTAEHPDVIRTRRLIQDLEVKAAEEAKRAAATPDGAPRATTPEETQRRERLSSLRAELDALNRQIAFKERDQVRLRGQIADYQARINAVPGLESEWTSLSRDYDTLQEGYRGLLAKSEEAKVAATLERQQIGEQFRVLDPAQVPLRPLSPQRLVVNAGGLALGLMLGLLIVGGLEFFDSTYHNETDVVNALTLGVLAVVPRIDTAADKARQQRKRKWVAVGVAAGLVVSLGLGVTLQVWRYLL
jgi:polysaccharide chain length determinant protein (PEP-CTERM system associated)